MVTEAIILCSTLFALWGASMFLWLYSGKPLIAITVQVYNAQEPTRLILKQSARHVFS